MKDHPAFVTGSHAYGTPREDSDLDLVVFVSPEDAARLAEADPVRQKDQAYEGAQLSVRFGKLNLLLICSDEMYEAWRAGTEKLKAEAPVSRDHAISVMYDERKSRDAQTAETVARKTEPAP